MSRKLRKKPLITKNWLPIEYVKGVPNVLSSYVLLANMKKEREAAGKPPSDIHWCVFCGRAFMNIQARTAHLKACPKRKIYKSTKAEGWRFTIGSRAFIVRTMIWSWLRAAEEVERDINERIAAGTLEEAQAIQYFQWYALGHQDTNTRADAAIDPAPAAAVPGEA